MASFSGSARRAEIAENVVVAVFAQIAEVAENAEIFATGHFAETADFAEIKELPI